MKRSYIEINAVKRLIASKYFFCLHNICVYIYVYINTHTYGIYLENINMYIFKFI